jgi:hypothetical protein
MPHIKSALMGQSQLLRGFLQRTQMKSISNKLSPDREWLMGLSRNGVGCQHKGFVTVFALEPLLSIFFTVFDDVRVPAMRTAGSFLFSGQEL